MDKTYQQSYYENNKDKLRSYQKQYEIENRESIRLKKNGKKKDVDLYYSFIKETGRKNITHCKNDKGYCENFREYIKYICKEKDIDLNQIKNEH